MTEVRISQRKKFRKDRADARQQARLDKFGVKKLSVKQRISLFKEKFEKKFRFKWEEEQIDTLPWSREAKKLMAQLEAINKRREEKVEIVTTEKVDGSNKTFEPKKLRAKERNASGVSGGRMKDGGRVDVPAQELRKTGKQKQKERAEKKAKRPQQTENNQ